MKPILTLILALCAQLASAHEPATTNSPSSHYPFMENKGQVGDQHNKPRPDVLFSGTDGKLTYHLRTSGVSYQLYRVDTWKEDPTLTPRPPLPGRGGAKAPARKVPDQMTIQRIDVEWIGANTRARNERSGESPDYDNFYNATAPDGVTEVRSYESVRYKNLYPGIDLKWYTMEGKVKYDFEVGAGADHSRIALRVSGADKLSINEAGELVISTPLGEIIEERPVVVQGEKKVDGEWRIEGSDLHFHIEGLAPHQAFVIDPGVRTWGTYYGEQTAAGSGVSTDTQGNVFMTGYAIETAGLATSAAHQTTVLDPDNAYLVKFNVQGQRLWCTYYGGERYDEGRLTTTAPNGDVYLLGQTGSAFGIATPGTDISIYSAGDSIPTGFIAKFDGSGLRLWGTYTRSNPTTCGSDDAGELFVGGVDLLTDPLWPHFEASQNAHQTAPGGGETDLFIEKFDLTGNRLWGTFVGGPQSESSWPGIAVGPSGEVCMGGATQSPTSIAMGNTQQPTFAGLTDGFVVKYDGDGNKLWGSYYGHTDEEGINDLGIDASGNIYVGGIIGFPAGVVPLGVIATAGAHQEQPSATPDYTPFLAKFLPDGQREWGTFYGADSAYTQIWGCKVTGDGSVYVMGVCSVYLADSSNVDEISADIATPCSHEPVNLGWLLPSSGGAYQPWLAKFTSSGQPVWGSFFGGRSVVYPSNLGGLAVDEFGHAYLCGVAVNDTAMNAQYPGTYSDGTEIATPDGHQPVFLWDADESPGGMATNAFLAQFIDDQDPLATLTACGSDLEVSVPAIAYQWIDCTTSQPVPGATAANFTAPSPGSYAVQVVNGVCSYTTACITAVDPAPLQLNVQAISGCGANGSVVANITSGGVGPFTYTWSPPVSSDSRADDLPDGEYTVSVNDAGACTDTSVTVLLDNALGAVFVPNAFSPNGNTTNELHCVYSPCIATMNFAIYDRWGKEVFVTDEQSDCWDGSYKGQELDPAVFVYKLSGTLTNGEAFEQSGNITLVR